MTKPAAIPVLERCDPENHLLKNKKRSEQQEQEQQQQQLSNVAVVVAENKDEIDTKLKKRRIFEGDNISDHSDDVSTKKKKKNKDTKLDNPSHHSTATSLVVDLNKPAEAASYPLNPRSISDGRSFLNISDLLFTQKRDYLVKSNGHTVKARQLQGKYVLIYLVSLAGHSLHRNHHVTANLIDIYNQLLADGHSFEVVLLATKDSYYDPDGDYLVNNKKGKEKYDEELESWGAKDLATRFLQLFCSMPWPAVPFWDEECRERVETILNYLPSEERVSPFFISLDPKGKILEADEYWFVNFFGAKGFPWSYESLMPFGEERLEAFNHFSLKTLLGSSDRDFLIDGHGREVPISDLENKVVGLYFYNEGHDKETTEKLMVAYHELKARGENFEVVLIYLQDYTQVNLQSFWENIRDMPWLTLPFRDSKIPYLRRVFGFSPRYQDNMLEVIGADGTYNWEIRADPIFKVYGIEAYPFTPKKGAELEAEKLRKIKLDLFLGPDVVFRRGNDQTHVVSLQELADKRVLLLFANKWCFRSSKFFYGGLMVHSSFLSMLKRMYRECKGEKDEFEVIYISFNKKEATRNSKSLAKMPWLVHHPFHGGKAKKILKCISEDLLWGSALVAFGRDGKLLAKSIEVLSKKTHCCEFPFVKDLERTTLKELIQRDGRL